MGKVGSAMSPTNTIRMLQTVVRTGRLMKLSESDMTDPQKLGAAVAEIFTGQKGEYVKLDDTIKGFNMILAGELDDLPEAAFYLVGNIDQVKAKAAKILAEANKG